MSTPCSDLPEIVEKPSNVSIPIGSSTTFTCVVNSKPPAGITWLFNSVVIPDATQPTYTIAMVTGGDAGTYSCVVASSIGIAHASAILTVLCKYPHPSAPPPLINTSFSPSLHTHSPVCHCCVLLCHLPELDGHY